MAVQPSSAYPIIVPSPAIGGGMGLPAAKTVVPWQKQTSDQTIRGALKINPAAAASMIDAPRWTSQAPRNNQNNSPLQTRSKVVAQAQATEGGTSPWKDRALAAMSSAILWGNGKPQKPVKVPWNKVFIPPLALFNDASQWVNRLMFNAPMQRSGNGNSMPNVTGVYLGSQKGPPIITNNLAGGALNAQLQLGILAIQAQQLTISASNYFGGS